MTVNRTVKRALVAGLGAVAIAAALPVGVANADVPCIVTTGDLVRQWPSYNANVSYGIRAGGAFQSTGLLSGAWTQGNYPGSSTGWFPTTSLQC